MSPHYTFSPRLLASARLNSRANLNSSSTTSVPSRSEVARVRDLALEDPGLLPGVAFNNGLFQADVDLTDWGLPVAERTGGPDGLVRTRLVASALDAGLGVGLTLNRGKRVSSEEMLDGGEAERPESNSASRGSWNGGETLWLDFGATRGIGRPPILGVLDPERVEEEGKTFVGAKCVGDRTEAGISSKSLSKIPSSMPDGWYLAGPAMPPALCKASSRLSISTYSKASASSKPMLSSLARCALSLPFALRAFSDSCFRRLLDSITAWCNSTCSENNFSLNSSGKFDGN